MAFMLAPKTRCTSSHELRNRYATSVESPLRIEGERDASGISWELLLKGAPSCISNRSRSKVWDVFHTSSAAPRHGWRSPANAATSAPPVPRRGSAVWGSGSARKSSRPYLTVTSPSACRRSCGVTSSMTGDSSPLSAGACGPVLRSFSKRPFRKRCRSGGRHCSPDLR